MKTETLLSVLALGFTALGLVYTIMDRMLNRAKGSGVDQAEVQRLKFENETLKLAVGGLTEAVQKKSEFVARQEQFNETQDKINELREKRENQNMTQLAELRGQLVMRKRDA